MLISLFHALLQKHNNRPKRSGLLLSNNESIVNDSTSTYRTNRFLRHLLFKKRLDSPLQPHISVDHCRLHMPMVDERAAHDYRFNVFFQIIRCGQQWHQSLTRHNKEAGKSRGQLTYDSAFHGTIDSHFSAGGQHRQSNTDCLD
jgi:hypothetical protein